MTRRTVARVAGLVQLLGVVALGVLALVGLLHVEPAALLRGAIR